MAEHEPVIKDLRDGTVTLFDGSTPRIEIEMICDAGDLSFDVVPQGREKLKRMDRGSLSHLRLGDEVPVTVNFGVNFREFISVNGLTPKTVFEAINKTGRCSDLVSTNDDNGEVYTLGLEFSVATPTTSETAERVVFAKVAFEKVSFAEGDPNTLKVSGFDFETAPDIDKHTVDCETSCETGCETAQED